MQSAAQFFSACGVERFVPGQPTGAQQNDISSLKNGLLRSCDFFKQVAADREFLSHRWRLALIFQVTFSIDQYAASDNPVVGPMLDSQLLLQVEILILTAS